MNLIKYLFAGFLMISFLSCDKQEFTFTEDGLIGYWINPTYSENSVTYDRADGFVNGYGIAFLEEGEFLVRQNVGWCGTPPITYGDYEGTWEEDEDGQIHTESPYWGGIQERSYLLISVDENNLVLEVID